MITHEVLHEMKVSRCIKCGYYYAREIWQSSRECTVCLKQKNITLERSNRALRAHIKKIKKAGE